MALKNDLCFSCLCDFILYLHVSFQQKSKIKKRPMINSLMWHYRMSKNQAENFCELQWTFTNPFTSCSTMDVCLRKMTLHTQRAPNNCGASGRASRTEIKQVLSHNPCLLKINLFRRGWWILGCILAVEATVWWAWRYEEAIVRCNCMPLFLCKRDTQYMKAFDAVSHPAVRTQPSKQKTHMFAEAIHKQRFYWKTSKLCKWIKLAFPGVGNRYKFKS